jgi:uncharacterized protein YihD (DUF1040 family)
LSSDDPDRNLKEFVNEIAPHPANEAKIEKGAQEIIGKKLKQDQSQKNKIKKSH